LNIISLNDGSGKSKYTWENFSGEEESETDDVDWG